MAGFLFPPSPKAGRPVQEGQVKDKLLARLPRMESHGQTWVSLKELEAALADSSTTEQSCPVEGCQIDGRHQHLPGGVYSRRCIANVVRDATMAEHQSHIDFENELYATLVDPLAEGSIKEAQMRKQLLESARWYRQHVHDLESQLNAAAALRGSGQAGAAPRTCWYGNNNTCPYNEAAGAAPPDNDATCASCGHKALDHGSEGRCYHVNRSIEPIIRCHCDKFEAAGAAPGSGRATSTKYQCGCVQIGEVITPCDRHLEFWRKALPAKDAAPTSVEASEPHKGEKR